MRLKELIRQVNEALRELENVDWLRVPQPGDPRWQPPEPPPPERE
jgi:hypothetical protein